MSPMLLANRQLAKQMQLKWMDQVNEQDYGVNVDQGYDCDAAEYEQEDEIHANYIGDLEAHVAQEDMEHDRPYTRAYGYDSDDNGSEKELDEDDLTEKENTIFLTGDRPRQNMKEICAWGNNKVVIYISLYHDKCLLFMLELY